MQRACDTQYPGRGLRAVATNTSSAYSWQCTGPGVSLGIDVTAECRAQYGYGAVSAVSNPASAWSWYCHWNITPQMQAAVSWATTAGKVAPVQQYPIGGITDQPYVGWAFPIGS